MTIYKSISALTSADGTLPILAGGTGANNAADARVNLGIDPMDTLTVSSGITAQSLAVSGGISGSSLAITSSATIEALTVSSNISALNSSFDTLDASSASIDYLSVPTLVASAANIDSLAVTSGITAATGGFTNVTISNLSVANSSTTTLTVTGSATFASSASFNTLTAAGSAVFASSVSVGVLTVSGSATFSSSATIGTLTVSGSATFSSSAQFSTLTATGSAVFSSSVTIGTLTVSGSATFSSSLSVLSASATTLYVSSDVTLGSSTSTLTFVPIRTVRPNMPSFLALSTVNQANVTGNSTAVTVQFGDKVYDRAANYSTATFTFTAPITGVYALSGCIGLTGLTSNHSMAQADVVINSTIIYTPQLTAYSTSGTNLGLGWAFDVNLSSGNTVFVQAVVTGTSSGADIVGGSTFTPKTWFGGHLVG